MDIIETNKHSIIYKEKPIGEASGVVTVVPNTPYFRMKVLENKGERIKKDIPIEGVEILETFNGMIFNITLNGVTITTRPNMADAVVESFDDIEKIYKIFDEYNNNKYNMSLLTGVLSKYGDRIKTFPAGFVIDNIFLIDRTGVAWFWDKEKQKINTDSKKTNLGSGAICIVVNKTQNLTLKHNECIIKIDRMGYIILSKIEFLLNPNLKDNVFMHQLPKRIQTILQRNEMINKSNESFI
tara:strand:+ start:63 stop:782 length:720 start_codon:yes stop_codon:yes gene_type:complete